MVKTYDKELVFAIHEEMVRLDELVSRLKLAHILGMTGVTPYMI